MGQRQAYSGQRCHYTLIALYDTVAIVAVFLLLCQCQASTHPISGYFISPHLTCLRRLPGSGPETSAHSNLVSVWFSFSTSRYNSCWSAGHLFNFFPPDSLLKIPDVLTSPASLPPLLLLPHDICLHIALQTLVYFFYLLFFSWDHLLGERFLGL